MTLRVLSGPSFGIAEPLLDTLALVIARYLRLAAYLVVLVWIPWEIASEPPLLVLLLAFVAAWGLFIEFLVTLPRQVREWKRERGS